MYIAYIYIYIYIYMCVSMCILQFIHNWHSLVGIKFVKNQTLALIKPIDTKV